MEQILLHIAATIASFFQSVTGIGFGMIAGPVILIVLSDPAAVVISTLLSWLIAIALFPALRAGADWPMARRLFVGAIVGLPIGLSLLSLMSVPMLKLAAGSAIALLTAMSVFGAPGMRRKGDGADMLFGVFAGVFGAGLAMPGPIAAIRTSGIGHDKTRVRATMVAFFILIWPLIFTGQWVWIGISAATFWNAVILVPGTLAGLIAGNWAAAHVSERFFRGLVLVFLIATAGGLLINASMDLGLFGNAAA